jgi:hypothetical protein
MPRTVYGDRTSSTGELSTESRIWDLGFSTRLLTLYSQET